MAFWSSTSVFTSKVPRKILFMFTLSLSVTYLFYSLMSCYNSFQFQENYVYQGRLVTEETTFVTLREKLYSTSSQVYLDEEFFERTATEQTIAVSSVRNSVGIDERTAGWVRAQAATTRSAAAAGEPPEFSTTDSELRRAVNCTSDYGVKKLPQAIIIGVKKGGQGLCWKLCGFIPMCEPLGMSLTSLTGTTRRGWIGTGAPFTFLCCVVYGSMIDKDVWSHDSNLV